MAYAKGNENPKSIFARTTKPWDAGALNVHGGTPEKLPTRYAEAVKGSEEELTRAFGKLITDDPHTVLSGYNISRFDIPMMVKKFQKYGMNKELNTLKNMKVNDTYLKVQNFLDSILSEDARIALMGSAKGKNIWSGTKLGQVAEALGVDVKQFQGTQGGALHHGDVDNKIARAIDDVLSNPVEAAKRYSVLSHAEIIDRADPKTTTKGERVHEFSRVKAVQKLQASGASLTNPIVDLDFNTPTVVKDLVDDNGVSILDLKSKIVPTESGPVMIAAKQIKEEAKETAAKVVDAFNSQETRDKVTGAVQKAKKALTSPAADRALKFGALAIGGYVALQFIKDKMSQGDRTQYIDASVLGKGADDIKRSILKSPNLAAFNEHYKSQRAGEGFQLKSGKQIHKLVEEEFFRSDIGFGSEQDVVDHELGIKGNIDVLAEIDGQRIPIEVKSMNPQDMKELEEPKREHASQVNFYAHAVDAPGGYVMYVSQDNIKERKTFYVPYSSTALIRDVADFRSAIIENRDTPGILGAWGVQMQSFFESYVPPVGIPTPPVYDMNAETSRSKIRDQASRYAHLTPTGTPRGAGNTRNGSHYNRGYE